jgi:hypothetical protein
VLTRLAFLLLTLFLMAPLRAQNEPVKMTPEFAFTFPVTKVGQHDVMVKYPVFLNPATILKPGMVLRVIYLPPARADDSSNLVLAHKGTMEEAYSRSTSSDDTAQAKLPPEIAHALEGFRRTVWEAPLNFQLAMAQYPTDDMHIIYSPTGTNQDLVDQKFSFFDGLLIGQPDGKVTALAVENGSRADKAGFKAGDEIIAVGGTPIQNNLETFANAHAAARENARETNAASFPVTVRSVGKSEMHVLNLGAPLTIKSSLMEGF